MSTLLAGRTTNEPPSFCGNASSLQFIFITDSILTAAFPLRDLD